MKQPRVAKSDRADLKLPVTRMQRQLKRFTRRRIGSNAAVYMTAAIEYMLGEVLELAGNAARADNRQRITPSHIQMAIESDVELHKLLPGLIIPGSNKGVKLWEAEIAKQLAAAAKRDKKKQK